MNTYISIKENVTTQIIEKKSKFIADLFYVEDIKTAENIIKETKKKYHDARHHCIAFRIIENGEIKQKANDDGEPSGTAGLPMLKILETQKMCNVLIIVTRYFGGILLGTGGLVRAYSKSLINAVDIALKTEVFLGEKVKIEIKYNDFEKFKYLCEKDNINIVNVEYLENIVCIIEIPENAEVEIVKNFEGKGIKIKNYKVLDKRLITKFS